MYRPTQVSFSNLKRSPSAFGGSLAVGKRKIARPLCTKRSLHVVLRSRSARGVWNLLLPRNARILHRLLKRYGDQFDVGVYSYANVGNHCHLLIRGKSKAGLRSFLRVFPGQLAQKITGAKPGKALAMRFWEFIAFTRLVEWGKSFTGVKAYLFKNVVQAARGLGYSRLAGSVPP